jgi:hypothetical protein
MKKSLFISFLLLCFAFSVSAQKKTFQWDDELCQFTGTYDASKYTEEQLRNTQKLVSLIGVIPLNTSTTARNPEDIAGLGVEKLDAEYQAKKSELENMPLVPNAYWNTLRRQLLDELEKYYRLARVTMRAYQDPTALREYDAAECCGEFYIEPLIKGGEHLLATWHKVNLDSRAKNASPERLKTIYEGQNASDDRLKHARVEVMAFGWWNCAVGRFDFVNDRTDPSENFRDLFTEVKEECDEP